MEQYDDPGWADAIKRVWSFPIIGLVFARRRLAHVAPLIRARRSFVAIVASLFSILIVIAFIGLPWSFGNGPPWAPFLIAGVTAYAVGGSVWIQRRALPCSSEQQLAGSWLGAFLISLGVAQSVALMGFVLSFIADGKAWYLVGLAVTLPLLAASAPTRRAIDQKQRQLDAQGCALQLGVALVKPR